jgi:hypothetical protein
LIYNVFEELEIGIARKIMYFDKSPYSSTCSVREMNVTSKSGERTKSMTVPAF